jgi:hypothetical protein
LRPIHTRVTRVSYGSLKRKKKYETLKTWFQLLGSTTIHSKSFKNLQKENHSKPFQRKIIQNLQKEHHSKPSKVRSFKTFKRKIIQNLQKEDHSKPSKGRSFKTFKRKIILLLGTLRPNNKPKVLKVSPYCPQPVVSNKPKSRSL